MSALRLYGVNETAKLLQVCTSTVYKLLRSGKLQGIKAGATWKVSAIALAKFLKVEPEELREELKLADQEPGIKIANR